jgi:hypothetical protein
MTKQSKRILSVKIKRMVDTDPDTSYLGEYSNQATSEFSIDRAHSEDCNSVKQETKDAKEKLERINMYVWQIRDTEYDTLIDEERDALRDMSSSLDDLAEEITECDCGGHNYNTREFRYFNPSDNYKGDTPENIRKYTRQDYDRMESYNSLQWCYLGIRVEANVMLHVKQENMDSITGHIQTITSGGLWGIESDSDKSYIESVEQEELSALKSELKAIGFSTRTISRAFQDIERTED